MKKNIFLVLFLFTAVSLFSQSPKREFRAVWFQTVYGAGSGADWPATKISQTGNQTQISKQKEEFLTRLESLKDANVNAICFQARSRSDAMYKSSYEPWSSDLVSTRGMDPGYDPLEFVVEECHKRGMECHVWINPYRYESHSVSNRWDQLDMDYRNSNPDWILEVGVASILDPGLPEVREQITKVIKEIVENYDIDGVLFDDYFYLEGINDQDKATQNKYRPAGKELGDWRRENVNMLISDVYHMIQEVKPYVRFGLGPAGIWGGSTAAQEKFGVTNPPGMSGGYAFNTIYCDPVAWLYEGTIDYITPQIYWSTAAYGEANTDYGVLCPWWSDVANRFGKHMYVSQSAARVMDKRWPYEEEMKVQVEIARSSNRDNAPGHVYFNTRYFQARQTGANETLESYYKNNLYQKPALVPAINWKKYEEKKSPVNIRVEGSSLKWDSPDASRRYSIYAIPNEKIGQSGNFATSDYLLDVAYGNSFDLSENSTLINTHKFGVACLDDYGNEFSPGLMGYLPKENHSTTLTAPLDNHRVIRPTLFEWTPVEGSEYYILEVSEKDDFSTIFYRRDINTTSFLSSDIPMLSDVPYYWRVRTRATGVEDAISQIAKTTLKEIEILSPQANEKEVSLTPIITWENVGEEFTYVLQLSSSSTFTSNVTEFKDLEESSLEIADGLLFSYSSYYIRVKATKEEYETEWSSIVRFSTIEIAPEIPEIITPGEGEKIDSPIWIKWKEDSYAHEFNLQLSPQSNFAATNDRINKYIPAFTYEIEIDKSELHDNVTYYTRVRAHYSSLRTDWSPTVSFFHVGPDNIDNEQYKQYQLLVPTILDSDYVYIYYHLPISEYVNLYITDMAGKRIFQLYEGEGVEGENQVMLHTASLNKGVYLLTLETKNIRTTRKLIK